MVSPRWVKAIESRLGRRSPKRMPTKHLSTSIWYDWPYAGPSPGRQLREFVKSARKKEAREAWRIERLDDE